MLSLPDEQCVEKTQSRSYCFQSKATPMLYQSTQNHGLGCCAHLHRSCCTHSHVQFRFEHVTAKCMDEGQAMLFCQDQWHNALLLVAEQYQILSR